MPVLKSKSMEQKTALEWLVEQLNKQGFAQVVTDEEIDKALEMEKRQIIKSFHKGFCSQTLYCGNSSKAEQYYNQTYKQK